jgi:Cys-rich protein (TIGR01571 family)
VLAQCSLCCLVHMDKREALRRRYGLQEDCNDCLATTCCSACAMCQEARELKYCQQRWPDWGVSGV